MQDTRERLESILRQRIAVLDGSWGVLIQKRVRGEEEYRGERFRDHPLDVAGDPDLLNLTRPEIVRDIHRSYFEAGADIATTNTFTATRIGQADYGLQDVAAEMSLEGARLAREVADEFGGLVAGSVGPLNVALSLSPRVDDPAYRSATFDEVVEAYAEQIRALREGSVDLLLIETVFDTLNAKAAIVSASTARSGAPRCAPSSRTSPRSHRRGSRATRTPACRTHSASTTSCPRTRAASSGSSRATGS